MLRRVKVTEQVRGCVAQNQSHGREKAYRTKNDMKMFLTGKIKYKIIYARSSANGAIFMNAKNSRRIFALGSKQ